MVRALIIDDELPCCESLEWLLKQYCPEIGLLGMARDGASGKKMIRELKPELVFLDVEMPGMNGFEMLESITPVDFDIIFTTAFDQYAIRAIKFGALDFLIKPVDKDELRQAIDAYLRRSPREILKQLNAMFSHLHRESDAADRKIAFPSMHGYELVPVASIMCCESNSNYTRVKLENGRHLLVSRTLKDVEDILNSPPFFRVHHSFLINLKYVTRYVRGEGGHLVLSDNSEVPVSRNKKEELLKQITQISL